MLTSISDVASVASILGLLICVVSLVISIWVLMNTLKLKSEFRLFIGVPRLLNKLSESASSLLMLSRRFATFRPLILAELSKIEANIDSVKEKDEKTEGAVARFQIVIKIYRDDPGNKDKFWEVHGQLLGLIEKIKNIQEDRLEER